MIVGHGVDLVEVARIGRSVERFGDRFLGRVFTPGELAYALGRRRAHEHLAARFAAKEAALKALGTGWSGGVSWTEVEVLRQGPGRPGLALHGRAADVAAAAGVGGWLLSLSHTGTHAMASALALGAGS